MSGDDHQRPKSSQESHAEPFEDDRQNGLQHQFPGFNVTSNSDEASTASGTVQGEVSPKTTTIPGARANGSAASQSLRQGISGHWDDTSDSVPDDLPSVHVSAGKIIA